MSSFNQFESLLNDYWKEYQLGKLSKGDIVSIFLVLYNELFPTPNWLSWNSRRQHTTLSFYSQIIPQKRTDLATHPFFKNISGSLTLGQIMNGSLFKKETLRTNLGLMHIYSFPETIHILDYIPTPMEILDMQSKGFRCVTLLRSQNWYSHEFDHRRNLRDFIVHDLEHIWQMFENPEITKAQIEFSKKLQEVTEKGYFNFLLNSENFKREFDYIISDMNTHPAHMYLTLKSLLVKYFLSLKLAGGRKLDHREEFEIQELMKPFDHFLSGDILTSELKSRLSK